MTVSAFTELVGCAAPVQQAGMGGVATPELASAVARAGGVGTLPLLGAEPIEERLGQLDPPGPGAYAVNVLVPFLDRADRLDAVAGRVRIVECFWGDPDPVLVERIRSRGALAAWQVGSLAEAQAAARAGCDLVIAQGREAGGHVRGTTPLLELVRGIVASVRVPVVASGGIATAAAAADASKAGAAAVRPGTRFVATDESGAHPAYQAALVGAGVDATALTRAFGAGWPDAPHRVLRSALAAARRAEDPVGEAAAGVGRVSVPRWSTLPPTRDVTGDIGAMALYAGEGVDRIEGVVPAGAVVDELARALSVPTGGSMVADQ